MPVKVVIATPSAPLSTYLQTVISTAHPDYQVVVTDDWDAFTKYVTEDKEVTTVIADVIWGDNNNYYVVRQYSLLYPQLGWMIVSPFDISGIVNRSSGIPAISAPQDEQEILHQLSIITEDRRGEMVGPYKLLDYAGQSALGRCYKARHTTIDRQVTITVPPPNATEQDCELFRYHASVLGRISHPTIYTIYEIGEHNGKPFLSHESVTSPTLLELQTRGEMLDDRTVARVLNQVGAAMHYITSMGLYSTPIELDNITLAKDGVVKVLNVAVGSSDGLPPVAEQLANLSLHLSNMIAPREKHHPAVTQILRSMKNRAIAFEDYVSQSGQMEMALAPVKNVPVRKEQEAAVKAIKATEKSRHIVLLVGIPVAAIAIAIFLVLLLQTVGQLPGTNFKDQEKITAGSTPSADPAGSVQLGEFYVDRYEVSIAQYNSFLKKAADMTIDQLLPDDILSEYNLSNSSDLVTYFRIYKTTMLKYDSISVKLRETYASLADEAIKVRAFSRALGQFIHRNPPVDPKSDIIPSILADATSLDKNLLKMDFAEAKKSAEKLLADDNSYREILKTSYDTLQTAADGEGKNVDPQVTRIFNQAGITIDTFDALAKDMANNITALEKEIDKAKPAPTNLKPIHVFYPDDWDVIIENASHSNRFYQNLSISMDSPVFNVDFIDALAYAHYMHKRLLTETEWQRAAMGNDNNPFPWGKNKDSQKTNVRSDASRGTKGTSDNVGWLLVNQLTQDVSPFGVEGMAGNVSEWTVFQLSMDAPDQLLLHPKPQQTPSATTTDAKAPEIPDEPAKPEDVIEPWIQILRGSNYQESLMESKERRPVKFFYRHIAIGFRVGSTRPVGE